MEEALTASGTDNKTETRSRIQGFEGRTEAIIQYATNIKHTVKIRAKREVADQVNGRDLK